jgi:hypothetical protein
MFEIFERELIDAQRRALEPRLHIGSNEGMSLALVLTFFVMKSLIALHQLVQRRRSRSRSHWLEQRHQLGVGGFKGIQVSHCPLIKGTRVWEEPRSYE